MIEKSEVLDIASNLGLGHGTVEKDYVLGWLLHGINNHPKTRSWAFKGGTSLKKCFFETFRFSEDLDFTIKQKEPLDVDGLTATFMEIAEFLQDKAGIQFSPENFRFKIIDKGNGNCSAQGVLHYTGPLQMKHKTASIKLDLTTDELLVLSPVQRKVHHPYSDEPVEGIHALCYAFEEVVAEKIRALGQRIRPRDLYDVIHFFRNRELIQNPKLVCNVLAQKCAFKKCEIPTYEYIENHEKLGELEPQWEHMLAHQLPSLPPMSAFWQDLEPFFDWLHGTLATHELAPTHLATGEIFQIDDHYRSRSTAVLYKIQFAAGNRICIKMRYHGKERIIEPLSFRTAKNGNQLFYGFERDESKVKAYTISEIESVEITNLPYTEQHLVEISATGAISMPPLRNKIRQTAVRRARPRSTLSYKIQCSICRKVFRRKKMTDTKLRKHKNTYGTNCSGRVGYRV
jgi:predicted nucleotidyltransferase component of viral defense system